MMTVKIARQDAAQVTLAEDDNVIQAFSADRTDETPVFGPKALDVSPRIGHLHAAVDGASLVWAETSGGPIIIAGLPEGPHKVEITPVNANHQPIDRSVVVEFVIPGRKATK
jgi:hypothetical protein